MPLPARNLRPPKTRALLAFENAISELNDFFWLSLAGYHVLKTLRPAIAQTTKDFLPIDIASHQDMKVDELDAAISKQGNRLIRLVIVDAVTFYEEYLKTIIQSTLRQIGPDKSKKPKLQIDLSKISSTQSSEEFITEVWINQRTDEIISENYGKRSTRIYTALNIESVGTSQHNTDLRYVEMAGEMRNCIVHTGGTVDKRTFDACSALIPGIVINSLLPLTRELLFTCLGEMLNHARDIDLLVRAKYEGT